MWCWGQLEVAEGLQGNAGLGEPHGASCWRKAAEPRENP